MLIFSHFNSFFYYSSLNYYIMLRKVQITNRILGFGFEFRTRWAVRMQETFGSHRFSDSSAAEEYVDSSMFLHCFFYNSGDGWLVTDVLSPAARSDFAVLHYISNTHTTL